MASIRDIRRKARRQLHAAMRVPAVYVPLSGDPVLLHVRDHTKISMNVMADARNLADRQELTPSLIFMRDEVAESGVTLVKNGIVSIESGEAYRLQVGEPPDDITVRWTVSAITNQTELAGLPLPEDLDG